MPLNLLAAKLRAVDKLALNIICKKNETEKLTIHFKELNMQVCQTITQSELCKDVETTYKRDCRSDIKDTDDSTLFQDVFSCLDGILTSAHDIYQLVKTFLLFLKNYSLDENYRDKKNLKIEASVDNLLLNYEAEVGRTALTLTGPMKDSRASLIVANDLLISQVGKLMNFIKNETAEFACLNEAGYAKRSCQIVASLILPPAIFFKVLLKGPEALLTFAKSTIEKGKDLKIKVRQIKRKNELMKPGKEREKYLSHKKELLNIRKKGLEINRHESSSVEYIADKKAVEELYEKGKIKEGAKLAYELNIKRLLEKLSPEAKEKLNHIINSEYKILESEDLNAFFAVTPSKAKGYIQIELPKELHGTELEYLLKTHESYHAGMHFLQELKKSAKFENDKQLLVDIDFHLKDRFLDEAGAMAREWQYIDHIPKERLDQVYKETVNDSKFSESIKTFIKNNYVKEKSASSHVIQQHKKGRYSKTEVNNMIQEVEGMYRQGKFEKNIFLGLRAGTLGLLTLPIYGHCSDLKKIHSTSYFYRDICQKFPLFLGYFK